MKNNDENKVVKYSNDFNNVSLGILSKSEMNLVMATLHKIEMGSKEEVRLDFQEVRKLMNMRKVPAKEFDRMLQNLHDTKVAYITAEGTTKYVHLFSTLEIDSERGFAILEVDNEIKPILEYTKSGYTMLEMEEYTKLKSVYAKEIYRRLRQFRFTGKLVIKSTDLIDFLSPPKSYQPSRIMNKIIIPAIEELSEYFEDLQVNTKMAYNKLPENFVFTFKPQSDTPFTSEQTPKHSNKTSDNDDLRKIVDDNTL